MIAAVLRPICHLIFEGKQSVCRGGITQMVVLAGKNIPPSAGFMPEMRIFVIVAVMKDIKKYENEEYELLISGIGRLLENANANIANTINSVWVDTYWHIGKYIVEYEQNGNSRAEYGSNLLNRLSKDLTLKYGKGLGKSNLLYIRQFYMTFPKSGTVSHLLSWSHYYELLKSRESLEISFYMKKCEKEGWSVRKLKRQMKSMLFHRLAVSKDKKGVLRLANEDVEIQRPEDIIKVPYVLEFAGLPDMPVYKEKDLERVLVNNLSRFMLELGKGFAYIGSQYRFSIAG